MAITENQHKENIAKLTIKRFSDDKAPQLGFSGLFPAQTYLEKQVAIEVERNMQKIAVDVNRQSNAKMNTFSKYSEKIFQPPFFKEGFDFTTSDVFGVTFGLKTNPSPSQVGTLVNQASSYVLKIKHTIMRAVEKQRADILQEGVVYLTNGDSIDYKRKGESMKVLSGAESWVNHAESDPMKDIAEGLSFIREEGLSSGTTINAIMGSNAFSNFMSNKKVLDYSDWRRIERININMPQFDQKTGMVYHGQFGTADYIVNVWTYNSWYDDDLGKKIKYLDPNNVVMVSEDFVGETAHAGLSVIQNNSIVVQKGEFVVQDYVDPTKMSWIMEVHSAPLAIPISIDRAYSIKTA